MTPQQVTLVQSSWEKMQPAAQAAAELFFARLYGLDPTMQAMFKGDLIEQSRKLAAMINFVVKGLPRLDAILPGVQMLAQRYAGDGVRERHYETVGAALLWTLGKGLGPAFTDEIREAWAAAYGVLADSMREAARQPA
jgi:hemoglobin-like flavoprotein